MAINEKIKTDPDQAQELTTPSGVAKKGSRKRSIIVFTAVTLLNVALLAVLWTQLMTPRTNVAQTNDSSITGDISSPLIGQQAPDFNLPVLSNKDGAQKVQLSALKGKPVILNFWANWCDPCHAEAPFLQRSWPGLQSHGVYLLGVDDGPEDLNNALDFVHKYNITYSNVKDSKDGATAIAYGTTGKPETFFIDKNGIVVARWIGPLSESGLQKELARLHIN